MTELFADDYPKMYRRCGMDPWLDIARAVGLVGIATVLLVVWFRLRGGDDPPG